MQRRGKPVEQTLFRKSQETVSLIETGLRRPAAMHRFYLPTQPAGDGMLVLAGSEAHHALRVLRVRQGERITVLDGAGREFLCDVADAARSQVRLKVVEAHFVPPLPYQLTLLSSLPKGKVFETILQKSTELGATRIVPLLAERVVRQLDEEDVAQKTEKWRGVAIEAIKQCGAAWLPEVAVPVTPAQFLARREHIELPLVASLQNDSKHAREYFRAFHAQHGRLPKSVCVWIGPEGDFSPTELEAIQAGGARPITLGRLVLRTDTAAAYCLAIINYEMQSSAP
jgi:16S rRNA (uracil1498-N3)-methyltransferase